MEEDGEAYSETFESEEEEQEPQEELHKLRLSIEVRSIKEVTSPDNLYVKYNTNLLGLVKTNTITALKGGEHFFENNFKAHEFSMTKSELYPSLTNNSVIFEIIKRDTFEKDSVIGEASLSLDGLLRAPLKKTPESVLRMYDIWVPIQFNEARIGELHLITCLEDLGPESGALAQEVRQESAAQLEIDAWKRVEETRWKASLKDKESAHLAEKCAIWQQREFERENMFQKLTTELTQIEARVKSKASELSKREQRLVNLQEEFRTRQEEVLRQLVIKEEEIQSIKNIQEEEKKAQNTERNALNAKLLSLRNELTKTEEELHRLRREDANMPIQNEISNKQMQLMNLEQNLESSTRAKDMYKQQCEQLSDELERIKHSYEAEKASRERAERAQLREAKEALENAIMPTQAAPTGKENAAEVEVKPPAPKYSEEVVRLQQEREMLIGTGMYSANDPLILELDNQISNLKLS